MAKHHDDPAKWPALGRAFNWVDQPGNPMKLVKILAVACALVLAGQLTYQAHGYMEAEHYFGFYAGYGFVMFTALIFAARGLRYLVKRDEGYYAPHVIDTEDYPEDELGRESIDD